MPRAKNMALTAEEVRRLLDYDPDSGVFVWRENPERRSNWNTRWAGTRAGENSGKHRVITIDHVGYLASRLAWLHVTGSWPQNDIDHINCDPTDDRFCNLRDATCSQNLANTRLRARNTSGAKGVHFDRSREKWMAFITVQGRYMNLGRFATREEAQEARTLAAAKHFGEFARAA